MSNVNIAGRVVKAPESRSIFTTLLVVTYRVKIKDSKADNDEACYTAEEAGFHKFTCFNGLARSGASRKKDDVVAIAGSLHYLRWEDRAGCMFEQCR